MIGRSAHVVVGMVAVLLATLSGCRSASQTDLVEREMRQQEDQIYALQDYLSDYQQLLCEYRRENESLKRQLVTGQFRDGEPSRRRDRGPRMPTSPALPEEQPPDDELTPPPADIPPLDFDESDIPPLETTSAEEYGGVSLAVTDGEPEHDTALDMGGGDVTTVAFEEPLPADVAGRPVDQVVVRGEVWPGDATAGPRVMVTIDLVGASSRLAEFRGDVSLMVLDANAEAGSQNLARWDFTPDQWQPMVVDAAHGTRLEFPLQLPADVPADRPVELWVRLVPDEGEKVLTHTAIDLGHTDRFELAIKMIPTVADRAESRHAEQPAVDPAIHKLADASLSTGFSTGPVHQSDWQTALPGEIRQLASSRARNVSEWRTATQPIPEVAEPPIYPTPPARSDTVLRGSPDPAPVDFESTPPPRKPLTPTWTPDRPGKALADAHAREDALTAPPIDHLVPPQRPAWSPER